MVRGVSKECPYKSWELTEREIEVLELLSEGLSNAQIADAIFASLKTVEHHTNSIYRKFCDYIGEGNPRVKATLYYLENFREPK